MGGTGWRYTQPTRALNVKSTGEVGFAPGTVAPIACFHPEADPSSEEGEMEATQRKNLTTALAVILAALGGVVVATTGDSWAVRMILALVTLDVAIRFARWGRRN